MRPTLISRLIHAAITMTLAVAAVVGLGAPASAGGWAVASLDRLPEAEAGTSDEVAFTILQHGVTPAVLDDGVSIEITHRDGRTEVFPAVADGVPGRYVAEVTFPESVGTYEWRVRMGWFGPHELGTLDVRASQPAPRASWPALRWAMLGGSLLLASVAAADVVASRRRRPALG